MFVPQLVTLRGWLHFINILRQLIIMLCLTRAASRGHVAVGNKHNGSIQTVVDLDTGETGVYLDILAETRDPIDKRNRIKYTTGLDNSMLLTIHSNQL